MGSWYILDDKHNPVRCLSHTQRDAWIESLPEEQQTGIGCVIDRWEFNEITVSTVFLSLDHSFDGDTPILFETMIFGGDRDGECHRYATWDEAQVGHDKIVCDLKASISKWP